MGISKFRLSNIAVQAAAGAIFAVACVGAANATTYMQGFETACGDCDWTLYTPGALTPQQSAPPGPSSGSYYANITNTPNHYAAGYGEAGYTYFGGRSAYVGDTTQSLDIYIDPAWAAGSSFWLDMSPANQTGLASNYAAESNFRFSADGSQVNVNAHGNVVPMASITTAGWYTFQMMFSKGTLPTDPIIVALSIFDHLGTQVGSTVVTPTNMVSYGDDYQSQYLGSGGYAWLTVWKNGSAGDVLHIDNANQMITPLPAALPLFGSGLGVVGGILGWRKRRKRVAQAAA